MDGRDGSIGTCGVCEVPHPKCSRYDWTELNEQQKELATEWNAGATSPDSESISEE